MTSKLGHASTTDSGPTRFIGAEPAIGAMAKRAATAHTTSGIHLDGGGRDGATTWLAPHHENAAPGLHQVEEPYACGSASDRTGTSRFSGTVGTSGCGASGVCGGVGIGT